MSKAIIKKKHAEALDVLKAAGWDNTRIVLEAFSGPSRDVKISVLQSMDDDDLMMALVNGYEPERTLVEELQKQIDIYYNGGDREVLSGFGIALHIVAKHRPELVDEFNQLSTTWEAF